MSPTEVDVANRSDGPGQEPFLTPPEAHQATYPSSPVGHLFAPPSSSSVLPPAAQLGRSRPESRTRLRTKTPAQQDSDSGVECRKVVTRARKGWARLSLFGTTSTTSHPLSQPHPCPTVARRRHLGAAQV